MHNKATKATTKATQKHDNTIKALSKKGLIDYLNRNKGINKSYTFWDLKEMPKSELVALAKTTKGA